MKTGIVMVIIVEDDFIIRWFIERQLALFFPVEIHAFESREDLFRSPFHADIIFTNLKLVDGWVDDQYLTRLLTLAKQVIVITGLGNFQYKGRDVLPVHMHLLYKPFTGFQFKSLLNLLQSSVF